MGKHSYLYPLRDDERWLWRTARMDGSDLFGTPDPDTAPPSEWVLNVGVSEALGAVRDELHRRLESRPRICIGRHYAIPGSLCESAQAHEIEADWTVREVTGLTWDAPSLGGDVLSLVQVALHRSAGQDGRDDWGTIEPFLTSHRGQRVIPVWM